MNFAQILIIIAFIAFLYVVCAFVVPFLVITFFPVVLAWICRLWTKSQRRIKSNEF